MMEWKVFPVTICTPEVSVRFLGVFSDLMAAGGFMVAVSLLSL